MTVKLALQQLLKACPATTGGWRYFAAPGRVNIIGEHTDHNGGLVLPTTTALHTYVGARLRADNSLYVHSLNLNSSGLHALTGDEMPDDWRCYVLGVARELATAGVHVPGLDLVISGDVPIGGGLSSSASLEVAVATAIASLCNTDMDALTMARICQLAEHRYAKVACGIMDQLAVAACKEASAMRLDCQTLDWRNVVIAPELSLLVVDSGFRHELTDGRYNERTQDCQRALAALNASGVSVHSLSDVSKDALQTHESSMDEQAFRRLRHVVHENARVEVAVGALAEGNIRLLGEAVNSSHCSLRDDYEVSCEAIEALREVALSCENVAGVRMIGGGFGGCVLVLSHQAHSEAIADEIRCNYRTPAGDKPWLHQVSGAQPAREVQCHA